MVAMGLAEIPDYRWDLEQHPQTGGYRSPIFLKSVDEPQKDDPDYSWEQHRQSYHVRRKAPEKRRPPGRAQSDISDNRFAKPMLGRGGTRTKTKEAEDIFQKRHSKPEVDDSSTSSESEDTDDAHGDLYSASDEEEEEYVEEETDDEEDSDSDDESSSSSDEEEEETMGFNWKLKKPMLLESQQLTCKGKKPKQKRRILVKFSSDEPVYHDLPALTEEDKKELFWTKAEIRSFRHDRERERSEKQREKYNSRTPDNTAKLGSIWGGAPKKKADANDEEAKARKLAEEQKKAKQAEKEAEQQSVMDALMLAMEQAKMVTGLSY